MGVGGGLRRSASRSPPPTPEGVIPFRGQHQAGIITPAQDRLHFAAIDLTTTDRAAVKDLLQRWTRAAERMTAGAEATPGGAVNLNPDAPPTDTGEALGLPPVVAHAHVRRRAPASSTSWASARSGPPGSRRCRRSSSTRSTRRCPGATCACRRAPTTRRSPCTPSATWSGWASAPRRCGGRSSGSGARRRRRRARPRRATCSASRTAPATSRPRTPTCCATTSGCRPAPGPPGSRAAATWSPAGSGCTSRSGTAPRSPSRRASSVGTRARARPAGRRRSSTSRTSRTRPSRPTRTSGWRRRRTSAGCGSCGGATTSSTAATGRATSTRACSSWPTCATRTRTSCRCSARSRARTG